MVRPAASRSAAVRSGCLVRAISSSWARLTAPTLFELGVALPLAIPALLRSSTEAGGVLVMKVKLLSLNTVMTTGIGNPGSSPCVRALNCLQNSMMFTPRWPSAGPTGGLGLAWAAATCSLM